MFALRLKFVSSVKGRYEYTIWLWYSKHMRDCGDVKITNMQVVEMLKSPVFYSAAVLSNLFCFNSYMKIFINSCL